MRFEKAKKFLRANVARILCAGMIAIGAVVATPFSSFAAVTGYEMAQEVPMYDPKDGSSYLVKNRSVADMEVKKYGCIMVTADSAFTDHPIAMTQRMTADQAKYKAKFFYMAAGYDEATATAMVNAIASRYEASPDKWYSIAWDDAYVAACQTHLTLEKVEALEKQMTGTVMTGTHQAIHGHSNDVETATATSSAASEKKASSAAEEVDQLYASLIASGKTSEQAMAEVNAQLASIIAKYAK